MGSTVWTRKVSGSDRWAWWWQTRGSCVGGTAVSMVSVSSSVPQLWRGLCGKGWGCSGCERLLFCW